MRTTTTILAALGVLVLGGCGGGGDGDGCKSYEEILAICLDDCREAGIPADVCERTFCDDDGIQETIEARGLCLEA